MKLCKCCARRFGGPGRWDLKASPDNPNLCIDCDKWKPEPASKDRWPLDVYPRGSLCYDMIPKERDL